MKKKMHSSPSSDQEPPFSFKKSGIEPEKINEHWRRVAAKLDLKDRAADQECDKENETEPNNKTVRSK